MDTKQYARIHKALSNENRLEIFYSILRYEHQDFEPEPECITQIIMQSLCIGASTISHHLKELSDAGLITLTKKGKYLEATVNKQALEELKKEFSIRG